MLIFEDPFIGELFQVSGTCQDNSIGMTLLAIVHYSKGEGFFE
ncbi:hypothetical protein [Mesotoga sp. H07.pep.5.3]|nr:hypothetical protein [Mesotoga sp. H07.pep.5.3]